LVRKRGRPPSSHHIKEARLCIRLVLQSKRRKSKGARYHSCKKNGLAKAPLIY